MGSVLVIGGGPAGIMAACQAAEGGMDVTLIERNNELLKKLLITGNGKCNYSNENLSALDYGFETGHPFYKIINDNDSAFLEDYFLKKGMLTYKKGALKYPRSEKAETLRNLLLSMVKERNIKVITGKKAVNVEKEGDSFRVDLEDKTSVTADKLIIASGGKAYPSTGSDGGGYRLARALGHTVTFTYPVLTKLLSDDKDVLSAAGVRIKGKVTGIVEGKEVSSEEGEIQFTETGLSGICIFNLSRFLSKPLEEGVKCSVIIDFLPEMEENELVSYIENITAGDISTEKLSGLLGEKIIKLILKKNGDAKSVAKAIKHFEVNISGHDSFNNAQVTKGGVSIEEVGENLESKLCPNLFFAGEVLDVDAPCGGYNLHWAFVSGMCAGKATK